MPIKITGTGSYIPKKIVRNDEFIGRDFFDKDGNPYPISNKEIIEKFQSITGIKERRYADNDHNTSDLATFASVNAIKSAKIDKEEIDYIIVAHNFGEIDSDSNQYIALPSVATLVKHKLGIQNPNCVAYDLIFGCPGWVEGVIQSSAYIKAGMAKKCLVIGADTLSRTVDLCDRDSMIFADGAGASIIEESSENGGILSHKTVTYSGKEALYLFCDKTFSPNSNSPNKHIKMNGRKVYEFAISIIPNALKQCLEDSGKKIHDVKKIFLHQANEKLDEAVLKYFYKLFEIQIPEDIMPISVDVLGNTSVATIPTLYDIVRNENFKGHELQKGDVILFASVGAGMNVNAITYQI
jgi:3-oxoacyl-[acyl-carrier-protein] synthase-3